MDADEHVTASGTATYYAVTDEHSRPGHPAGVLRVTADGDRTTREAFGRNLAWRPVTAPPDDSTLTKITAEKAGTIVTRMRHDAARER